MKRQQIVVTCKFCGKALKGVRKQDPDMPNGVTVIRPQSHKCKDGQTLKY